jgi:hypothetical protein
MSKGSGRIERRIGELFAATKDRALSVGDLARHAFELADGVAPDRKQRLSATRAAHRLLRRAAAAKEAVATLLDQTIAETAAKLGREPGGRGREAVYFSNGRGLVAVDAAFAEAMETSPSWPLWQQAWPTLEREQKRFDGALTNWKRRLACDRDHRWPALVPSCGFPAARVGCRDRTARRRVGRHRDHRH